MMCVFAHRKADRFRRMHLSAAVAFVVMIFICALLMPVSAFADSKEYSVPAADFDVRIGNDGSVEVTENWTVNYKKGEFTRFYKDIYRNVPAEEEFSLDPRSMTVRIDGQNCQEVFNSYERKDYTYFLDEAGTAYTVNCFARSRNMTRNYQISYRLKDAVKYVDREYFLVTLRLIPANFSETVKTVTAKFTAPDGSVTDLRNGQYFDEAVSEGNTVSVKGKNWDGVFKVKVRIDQADIKGAKLISSNELSNAKEREMKTPRERFVSNVLPGVIAFSVLFIIFGGFLLLWLYSSIKQKRDYERIEKNIAGDPYFYFKVIENWKNRLDPIEFAFGSRERWSSRNVFYAIFNNMFYRGNLQSDDGDIINVLNDSDLSEPEKDVLRFLQTNGKSEEGKISMTRFGEVITTDKKLLPEFETGLLKSIQSGVESKLSGEEMKQYKKDWNTFCSYVDYYSKKDLRTSVMEESNWPYFMILNDWVSSQPLSVYPESWDHGMILTNYYDRSSDIYNDYYSKSSDSGGSSCSSCSSCSGCGGGGAD